MHKRRFPLALYGTLLVFAAIAIYLTGVGIAIPRRLFCPHNDAAKTLNAMLVWYSGLPLVLGFLLIAIDFFLYLPAVRKTYKFRFDMPRNKMLTVVLTAYNDELSIYEAVKDFAEHPMVKRVIVISNNSKDRTLERAREAGATACNESIQGYGACICRALQEGIQHDDTDLTLLCEGDRTFRAYDIEKLLSYLPHADIVCGSRTTDRLREHGTQLTTFIHYGNYFVSKLLEAKHLGRCTFSDLGTTYKLFRNEALRKILPVLCPYINLEFNPYFLDTAASMGFTLVECPVTFHPRVGVSKGGNVNNIVAFKLGIKMIWGVIAGWNEKRK
jgi:glycosyltransferase involved in cell wall biosynthesis